MSPIDLPAYYAALARVNEMIVNPKAQMQTAMEIVTPARAWFTLRDAPPEPQPAPSIGDIWSRERFGA